MKVYLIEHTAISVQLYLKSGAMMVNFIAILHSLIFFLLLNFFWYDKFLFSSYCISMHVPCLCEDFMPVGNIKIWKEQTKIINADYEKVL